VAEFGNEETFSGGTESGSGRLEFDCDTAGERYERGATIATESGCSGDDFAACGGFII
jgi:hypothetical protein